VDGAVPRARQVETARSRYGGGATIRLSPMVNGPERIGH